MTLNLNIQKIIRKIQITIIIAIIIFTSSALANKDNQIRVCLENFKNIETLEIHSESGLEIYNWDGTELKFDKDLNSVNYELRKINKAIKAKNNDLLEVLGKKYRGSLVFIKDNQKIKVINILSLEEYLYGVVPSEMPASWPKESLKAQAICARTYAKKQMILNKDLAYDLIDQVSSQRYKGYDGENENTNKSVDLTRGLYLKYKGDYIDAFYHSCSGGYTESGENIWIESRDYLKSIEDPYSLNTPKTKWKYNTTLLELETILNEKGYTVGRIKSIEPIKFSDSKRVLELKISGTAGIQIFKKEEIRKVLGYDRIPSIWYTITRNEPIYVLETKNSKSVQIDLKSIYLIDGNQNKISAKNTLAIQTKDGIKSMSNGGNDLIIEGNGYGHGVGLSQWGAKNMATNGFTYDQILKFYYRNVNLISEE